jgi:polyisoprenoid-binding protein YceI
MRAKLVVGLLFVLSTLSHAATTNYKVDPVHSFAHFRIKHMNAGHVWGRFNDPTGTISIDDADASKSSFTLTLQTTKIDTGNKQRDDHLKGPDFFNAVQFPTITFKSTQVKKSEAGYEVTGDLTLKGTTKPITFTITQTGTGKMGQKELIGFETTVDVKRSDFGMNHMIGPAGDEVRLMISLEAVKQ